MPESLRRLSAHRGAPTRTFSADGPEDRPDVGVRWACGCLARGPSFEQLTVARGTCRLHLPGRAQVTLRLRLPGS